ncbi:MAG: hypothetical protein KKA84_16245, partial [Bacteroidetes bacterium]|nr:hypothetical protein [Bacteroidota bacterium]
MQNTDQTGLQNTLRNNIIDTSRDIESLESWIKAYFQFEVTTLKSSQKVQVRDLNLFLTFYRKETGSDLIGNWTPRLSQSFKINLQEAILKDGKRRWSDRTINRILSHLKTFAKWVHKHKPFHLGNPTEKLKNNSTTSLLEVERAWTKTEIRKLLDAADLLIQVGGLSKDRHRYRKPEDKPKRKNYRPYRNRAIIYTLI